MGIIAKGCKNQMKELAMAKAGIIWVRKETSAGL